MKFTTGSKALLEKLQFLGAVIPANATIVILNNFLFEITKDKLGITASDLETTISTELEINGDGEATVAIPAKMLIEILKAFPDQPMSFEIFENNTIEISSENGTYQIAYQNGREYPQHPAIDTATATTIPAKVLLTAITKTIFAAGNDDLRPTMSGVLVEFGESGLNFVATDAHKLAKYSRNDIKTDFNAQLIVPKKPLNVLKSVLPGKTADVEITFNDSNMNCTIEEYTLTCRLIEGKYPNYRGVVPTDNPNVMSIDRSQLLNSVKCVSIFSNSQTRQVRLKVAGAELHISAEDIDYSNKADERLTCQYQGDDMQIGFNSRFLIEMLGILQAESVKLEMSTPQRAGILVPQDGLEEGEEIIMLVMPTVINK